MARSVKTTDQYRNKLLKLIPSEIVAAYMTLGGLVIGIEVGGRNITELVAWLLAGVLFALTPVYLAFVYDVKRIPQLVFTTLSFAVWAYWLGGPFELAGWHQAQLASIGLGLWTLLIPLFFRPEKQQG